VVSDTISGIEQNGNDITSEGSVFQFSNRLGDTYYIDESSDLFQTDNTLSNTGSTYTYNVANKFRPDFLRPSIILSFEYNTNECNVLSSTGYTDTFILPEHQDYDIVVGDDKFMYTFIDLTGGTNIHLYDFNGNLLNSLLTEHTSFNSREACGDGFVQIINENGNYYVYLVSETEISQSILTNDNDYFTFNDYVWWD
jgi:hypothetical protein